MTKNTIPAPHTYNTYDLVTRRREAHGTSPAAHQQRALEKLETWYRKNHPGAGGLLVLPTGGGKTYTATHFLCRYPLSDGYKVLWLAHTHHLLEQAAEAFSSTAHLVAEPHKSLNIRVISGTPGHQKPRDVEAGDDVLIATIQTFWNAMKSEHAAVHRLLDAAGDKLFVVVDEAHHTPATTYRKLIERLRARHPEMYLLGLTATPTYTDKRRRGWLAKLFPQDIIYQDTADELMAAGVLAKPIFKEPVHTNFSAVVDDGDFQRWLGTHRDLPTEIVTRLAESQERDLVIVDEYVRNKDEYGKTIIFADRWFQCERLAEALNARGVRAGAVYSQVDRSASTVKERNRQSSDENARVLRKFRNGELDVILNIRMLTEGTDVPDAKTVFLTRQTTSQILLTQMIGRALRGPEFGGTVEANIVTFIDDWKHRVQWAHFSLEGGSEEPAGGTTKYAPLQLVSIDLVRALARQMDSGVNVNPLSFLEMLPAGWYHVEYETMVGDDLEPVQQLLLVFDRDRDSYVRYVSTLQASDLQAFTDDGVTLGTVERQLVQWQEEFFSGPEDTIGGDRILDLFALARHVAQSEGEAPRFVPFAERSHHDLDKIANAILERKLDRFQEDEYLQQEYRNDDRLWRALYHTYDHFKSHYDGCINRLLHAQRHGSPPATHKPTFKRTEPSNREPEKEIKKEVFSRDGGKCLCCGGTRQLQVDHVMSYYHGGGHDLGNLQTLCKTCNQIKGTRRQDFRKHRTILTQAPEAMPNVPPPPATNQAKKPETWEKFLQRSINLFYGCAAVEAVYVGQRGPGLQCWQIDLYTGNDESWLDPFMSDLADTIRQVRHEAGLVAAPEEIKVAQQL